MHYLWTRSEVLRTGVGGFRSNNVCWPVSAVQCTKPNEVKVVDPPYLGAVQIAALQNPRTITDPGELGLTEIPGSSYARGGGSY